MTVGADLFGRRSEVNGIDSIILSIQRKHADKIFSGTKLYELRKQLPTQTFRRVYLHETGGIGIVGCFDIATILNGAIDQLWEQAGTDAAPKDRFFDYFEGWQNGYAIEVTNPIEFKSPLPTEAIRTSSPRYRPPRSSIHVPFQTLLGQLLNNKRKAELGEAYSGRLTLHPIRQDERDLYVNLTTTYIGRHYTDVDEGFGKRNLEVHDQGRDPAGFMTERKQVLSIRKEYDQPIGFTTLTYKRGGSVKSGPTILLEEFQGHGYGQQVREAIEAHVMAEGGRKVYCTCPEVSGGVVRYLINSGYKVEAHLRRHYNPDHDDLVFGKLLTAEHHWSPQPGPDNSRPGRPIPSDNYSGDGLAERLQVLFNRCLVPVGLPFTKRLVSQIHRDSTEPSAKRKDLMLLESGDDISGCVISLPKRGGAVKCHLLHNTAHSPSIERLVQATEDFHCDLEARKIYYLHPLSDTLTIGILEDTGYQAEGLLRSPYVSGRNLGVFGNLT